MPEEIQAIMKSGQDIEKEISHLTEGFKMPLPASQPDNKTPDKATVTDNKTPDAANAADNKTPDNKTSASKTSEEGTKKEEASPDNGRKILDKISDIAGLDLGLKKPEITQKTSAEDIKTDDGKLERDLTGFGEQEAQWLKRMPLDAYKHFAPQLKEFRELKNTHGETLKIKEAEIAKLREGKQELPESYYENPQAVVLSPEFALAQADYQTAQNIENHWAEQLRLVEEGHNWTELINDPKTGEVVLGKEYESNPQAKVMILRQLAGSQHQAQNYSAKLQNLVGGFQQKHQAYVQKIRGIEDEFLPMFKDDKSDAFKIYQQVIPELKKSGTNESNPLFNLLAKSMATNFMLRDAVIELQKGQAQKQALQADKIKAGPNANDLSGVSGDDKVSGQKAPAKFSELDKIISG